MQNSKVTGRTSNYYHRRGLVIAAMEKDKVMQSHLVPVIHRIVKDALPLCTYGTSPVAVKKLLNHFEAGVNMTCYMCNETTSSVEFLGAQWLLQQIFDCYYEGKTLHSVMAHRLTAAAENSGNWDIYERFHTYKEVDHIPDYFRIVFLRKLVELIEAKL